MSYHSGDYVYPADLPRRVLCRVTDTETLRVRGGSSQMLKLEPLEGPWPTGTQLIRLDDAVRPAGPRQLWQAAVTKPTGSGRPRASHKNAA